jgi:hypothetical protein
MGEVAITRLYCDNSQDGRLAAKSTTCSSSDTAPLTVYSLDELLLVYTAALIESDDPLPESACGS